MKHFAILFFMTCCLSYGQTFDFGCADPASADTARFGEWVDGEVSGGHVVSSTTVTEAWILDQTPRPPTEEFLRETRTVTFVELVEATYRDQTRECLVTVVGDPDDVAPTCDGDTFRRVKLTDRFTRRSLHPHEEGVTWRESTTPNPNYVADVTFDDAFAALGDTNSEGTYGVNYAINGNRISVTVTVEHTDVASMVSEESLENLDVNSDSDMLDQIARNGHIITKRIANNPPFYTSAVQYGGWYIKINRDPAPTETATTRLEAAIRGDGNLTFTSGTGDSAVSLVFVRGRHPSADAVFSYYENEETEEGVNIVMEWTSHNISTITVTRYDADAEVVSEQEFDYADFTTGDTSYLSDFITYMEDLLPDL